MSYGWKSRYCAPSTSKDKLYYTTHPFSKESLKITVLGWITLARRDQEVRVKFLTIGKYYVNIKSLVSRGVVIMIVKTLRKTIALLWGLSR
jgi:hypothetical protein